MTSISTYIKNDLAARLRSGRALPASLTLDALAHHYDVSFTPVRHAIAELVKEGLLQKGSNRRLTPVKLPVSTKAGAKLDACEPSSLPKPPQDPYDGIVNDLVQQSLQGEAIYLREEATAEKYGLSRSAIRHIFHRLAGEGMLNHIPRHGWQLRPFRQSDLEAFIDVREVLELKALDLSRDQLCNEQLQRMLEANTQPSSSPTAPPRIDESLHSYLIEASQNVYIREFFERQGRYYRLLFEWEDRDRSTALETARQHREILAALLNQDWARARQELSYHIRDHHPVFSQIAQAVNSNHKHTANPGDPA
ncbi:GntR family transcriptional regulator [Rhodopirellula maiorica SM1]|uniref:GntR family transcriptional regulator n=1 Tax=Rhodopirellula maiorica SM1 TaxID=1265738 RepID=M5RP81_9BACT|nr:GntR family transcriptional regulator [Rhodopirellula maiorica]EMI21016.1 GntR family transcriptional regulator [Rhodopirellula maiorica SM1]